MVVVLLGGWRAAAAAAVVVVPEKAGIILDIIYGVLLGQADREDGGEGDEEEEGDSECFHFADQKQSLVAEKSVSGFYIKEWLWMFAFASLLFCMIYGAFNWFFSIMSSFQVWPDN